MEDSVSVPRPGSRLAWVDIAKGMGIGLVFYGHFVERFRDLGVPGAAAQMRWIYSFHMPLFFLLVGLVYKERDLPFQAFITRQIRTRLVPVWVFNLVGLLIWIIGGYAGGDPQWVGAAGVLPLARHCGIELLRTVLRGLPTWNFLTWFVICLFMVELWHFGLRRWLRGNAALSASILVFAGLTVAADYYRWWLFEMYQDNFYSWRITSALSAMVFYQLGILLRRVHIPGASSKALVGIGAAACLAASFLTFGRNFTTVLMAGAQYGQVALFFPTALAGIFALVLVSRLLQTSRLLEYLGQITLGLMCLDGILHESVNRPVATLIVGALPAMSVWTLTGVCLAGTIASLALCIPVVWVIRRYAPFILGMARSQAGQPPAVESPGTMRAGAGPER